MGGGGKAFRRRQKNAEKANVSLHKAASGKGSVHAPLPTAPTKDDYKDKMPASLRKMLALKEVAEQPTKRRKLEQGHAAGQQQQAQSQHMRQDGKHRSNPVTQQQQHSQDASPPETGVQQQQQQNGQGKPSSQQRQQQQQAPQAGAAAGQQPKKLKQKKKEYLNAKKLKKKGQRGRSAADSDTELASERVAFGDVVHAPPEVALKSKHWATNSKAQQQQQRGGQKAVPGGSGKKHSSKQRPPKQQGAQDDDLLEARQQLIDSYRAARPAPQEGQATLKTLKELVRKQSGA